MNVNLVAGKVLIVILGLVIAHHRYRVYQRYPSRPILFISIDFRFLSSGSAVDYSLLARLHLTSSLWTDTDVYSRHRNGVRSVLDIPLNTEYDNG